MIEVVVTEMFNKAALRWKVILKDSGKMEASFNEHSHEMFSKAAVR